MTDLNLDAIEARANAATPGPWESLDGGDRLVAWRQRDDELGIAAFDYVVPEPLDNADDAEFIAHARTDVPALVAEARRLRALVARTREAIAVQIEAQRWPGHSPSCNCERCRDRAASASIARGAR